MTDDWDSTFLEELAGEQEDVDDDFSNNFKEAHKMY